jgi:hypothetical protein
MFIPPETMLVLAQERQRELIAEADQYRVLRAARRVRRARGAHRAEIVAAAPARPAGTLAPCEPRAAAPAR